MAKKKACKKSCGIKCSKSKEKELKPVTKQEYFFDLIKRAFGL